MRRRAVFAAVILTSALGIAGVGCGGDDKPQSRLLVDAWWNNNPATPADTGYQLLVDVTWPDRPFSCFSLPADIHVTVNDKQMPLMVEGNCGGESLVFVNGFQQNVPVTVSLVGGGQIMGKASFDNLFPGAAPVLITPADGQVKAGDPVVVQMPLQPVNGMGYPEFYWMEPQTGVPPYHTSGTGTLSADGSTFETTAPTTAGRAALVVKALSSEMFSAATSCTGFVGCTGMPNNDSIGPVFIDVAP